MKSIELKSGVKLEILNIPFAEAKDLYQALLKEVKSIKVEAAPNMADLMKDLICIGFYSKEIEAALWKCLARCTYNGLKIDKDTFEPLAAREDYSIVCIEVIQDTIAPFMKGLYAELPRLLNLITSDRK